MKVLKLFIAITTIFLFIASLTLVILFGAWFSSLKANGYARPLGKVLVEDIPNSTQENLTIPKKKVKVMLYDNDSAFSNLLTRDVAQQKSEPVAFIEATDLQKEAYLEWYDFNLQDFMRFVGFDHVYYFSQLKTNQGDKVQPKGSLVRSLFDLNRGVFRFTYTEAKIDSVTIDLTRNVSEYDIIGTEEGINLQPIVK